MWKRLIAALLLVVALFVVFNNDNNRGERDHSLQRMGHAAVVILHNQEMTRFLMQRKTEGYPYWKMVNTVCFFGGNKESQDVTARQTLLRELKEEAPMIIKTLDFMQPFARYLISASIEMMEPKQRPYQFECAVFSAQVEETNEFAITKEGNMEWISLEDLANKERFAWGYDAILRDFVYSKLQINVAFIKDYDKCRATRYGKQQVLGKWSSSNETWE